MHGAMALPAAPDLAALGQATAVSLCLAGLTALVVFGAATALAEALALVLTPLPATPEVTMYGQSTAVSLCLAGLTTLALLAVAIALALVVTPVSSGTAPVVAVLELPAAAETGALMETAGLMMETAGLLGAAIDHAGRLAGHVVWEVWRVAIEGVVWSERCLLLMLSPTSKLPPLPAEGTLGAAGWKAEAAAVGLGQRITSLCAGSEPGIERWIRAVGGDAKSKAKEEPGEPLLTAAPLPPPPQLGLLLLQGFTSSGDKWGRG